MAKPREDNGWWADGELVVGADGDAVCKCYWNAVLGGDNEPVEAEERARRIARLPELEAENAELRALLNRVYAYISEYLGKHAEMFEGLAIMDAIEALTAEEPEDEVE